jgi:hypothetical protein
LVLLFDEVRIVGALISPRAIGVKIMRVHSIMDFPMAIGAE